MIPLVICSIFRDEALYLKEWIEFHQMMGVSKFYLYNNGSIDNYHEILQPYIEQNIVDLKDWPGKPPIQCEAYADFIQRMNREPIWAVFIDIDEFLFSPVYNKVTDVLVQYSEPRSLGVSWKCFGSSNLEDYDSQPVIQRFIHAVPDSNFQNTYIKSIVRLDQFVGTDGDPHYFHTQSGNFNEMGHKINGSVSPHTSVVLRLNHYKTKSKGEWEKREKNGKPNAIYEFNWDHYYSVNTDDMVEDRSIHRFLPALLDRLNPSK